MRRMIFLAGLMLAVVAFLPGNARPAVGGTDLPFKSSFTGTSTLNLQTGHVHNVSSGPSSHFGLGVIEQDGYLVPDPLRPGVFTLITTNARRAPLVPRDGRLAHPDIAVQVLARRSPAREAEGGVGASVGCRACPHDEGDVLVTALARVRSVAPGKPPRAPRGHLEEPDPGRGGRGWRHSGPQCRPQRVLRLVAGA